MMRSVDRYFFSLHFLKKEYNKSMQKNFCITHKKILCCENKKIKVLMLVISHVNVQERKKAEV